SSARHEDCSRDRSRFGLGDTAGPRDRRVCAAGVRGVTQFEPFQGTIAPYAAGGVLLAGAAFDVLQRFVPDAARLYVGVAIVVLVLSWIPDVALLFINEPGATVPRCGFTHGHARRRRGSRRDAARADRGRASVSSTASAAASRPAGSGFSTLSV